MTVIISLVTAAVSAVVALVLARRNSWLITKAATSVAFLVAVLCAAGVVQIQVVTWVLGIALVIAAFNVIKSLGGSRDLTNV